MISTTDQLARLHSVQSAAGGHLSFAAPNGGDYSPAWSRDFDSVMLRCAAEPCVELWTISGQRVGQLLPESVYALLPLDCDTDTLVSAVLDVLGVAR